MKQSLPQSLPIAAPIPSSGFILNNPEHHLSHQTSLHSYLVGGAVRDALLGVPVGDCDYVVVGSTPQDLLALGFKPVGKDFPVFLHPITQAEYALARTERKQGHGYAGFVVYAAPDVSLVDDLVRRDLTINAIAQAADGSFIDPYGGISDLKHKIFRHVSPAFAEDPVRILRLARFAARYTDFTVAPETMALMCHMVAAGEMNHLVAERVWQELAKGLLEPAPLRMLEVLDACGALAIVLPELKALQGVPQTALYHPEIDCYVHTGMVLQQAVLLSTALSVRFAALLHDLGKAQTPTKELPRHPGHEALSLPLIEAICQRLKVPSACRQLALLVAAEHGNIHRSLELDGLGLLRLLQRCDALRQSARFELVLLACQADAKGRLTFENTPYPQAQHLANALAAAQSVRGGDVVAQLLQGTCVDTQSTKPIPMPMPMNPEHIAQAIDMKRIQAITAQL